MRRDTSARMQSRHHQVIREKKVAVGKEGKRKAPAGGKAAEKRPEARKAVLGGKMEFNIKAAPERRRLTGLTTQPSRKNDNSEKRRCSNYEVKQKRKWGKNTLKK